MKRLIFALVFMSSTAAVASYGTNSTQDDVMVFHPHGVKRTLSMAEWREKGILRDAHNNLVLDAFGQPITFYETDRQFVQRMMERPIVRADDMSVDEQ